MRSDPESPQTLGSLGPVMGFPWPAWEPVRTGARSRSLMFPFPAPMVLGPWLLVEAQQRWEMGWAAPVWLPGWGFHGGLLVPDDAV